MELSESSRAVTMVDGLPHAASDFCCVIIIVHASEALRVTCGKMACRVVTTLSTYSKSNTLAEAGAIERQLVLRLFVNG